MTGFKTRQRTNPRPGWRMIASGILSLWVGLAVADETDSTFWRWTMPGTAENVHREPASSLSTERMPDTENRDSDHTGVRSRLSRGAGGGLNGGANSNGSGNGNGGGGNGNGGGGGGGGGGGR